MNRLKGIVVALITPPLWSLRSGHFRSSLVRKAVDARGKPLAWYTYPALDFLKHRDFTGRSILEFGAGHSTLWWAARAESVLSFEGDEGWLAYLRKKAPENVTFHTMTGDASGLEVGGAYDVIVVDGYDRFGCVRLAPALLKEGGCVILDNSLGNWGDPTGRTRPILTHLKTLGFSRVDFYGMTPATHRPDCTSIFWKDSCFLFESSRI